MAVAEELQIIIDAKTADANRQLKSVSGQMDKTTKSAGGLEKILKRGLGAAAAAVSIGVLVRATKEAVEAFRQQEEAEAQLRGALLATGEDAEVVGEQIHRLASELQGVTTFGDEATIQATALLQSLADLDSQGLQQVIPAIQDFATGMGMDLNQAAQLVGKTLGSSTNALSRYGIEIDASASKQDKLAQLTDALNSKFGGLSQEMANTASGSLTQMNNALGDLAEQVGGGVLEFFSGAIQATTNFATALTGAIEKARQLNSILGSDGVAEEVSLQEQLAYWQEQQADAQERLAKQTENRITQNEVLAEDAREDLAVANERVAAIQRELTYQQKKANLLRQLNEGAIEAEEYLAELREAEEARQSRQAQRQKDLNAAYAQTKEGTEEATRAQIAYFRTFEPQGPKATAIIAMLQERLLEAASAGREFGTSIENSMAEAYSSANPVITKMEELGEEAKSLSDIMNDFLESDGMKAFDMMYASAQSTFSAFMKLEDQRHQAFLDNLDSELEAMRERHEGEIEFAEARGASEEELEEIRKQQAREEENLEKQLEKEKAKLGKEQFQRRKAAAIADATIQGALAVVRALAELGPIAGPIAAGVISGLTAAQIGLISQQKYPGFARGGEFVTNGPQAIVVGDNPGGRERVRIDPMPDNRSSGNTYVVNINGAIGSREEVAIWVDEGIRRARQRGVIPE